MKLVERMAQIHDAKLGKTDWCREQISSVGRKLRMKCPSKVWT
jgi:hypothetical protein